MKELNQFLKELLFEPIDLLNPTEIKLFDLFVDKRNWYDRIKCAKPILEKVNLDFPFKQSESICANIGLHTSLGYICFSDVKMIQLSSYIQLSNDLDKFKPFKDNKEYFLVSSLLTANRIMIENQNESFKEILNQNGFYLINSDVKYSTFLKDDSGLILGTKTKKIINNSSFFNDNLLNKFKRFFSL